MYQSLWPPTRRFLSWPSNSDWALCVEALGFGLAAISVRVILIAAYPGLYGNDPIARMFHSDQLVLAYQLPLLQALLGLAYRALDHPLSARLVSAATGAFAAAAFYYFTRALLGESGKKVARVGAVLFLVNPLFLVYSLVPYQEALMMGLLFLAGASFLARRRFSMSVALGLACLTRYEAWVVAVFLAAVELHRNLASRTGSGEGTGFRGVLKELVRTALLFGWAPIAWVWVNGGLAPSGTYVADTAWTWERLGRFPYLLERVVFYAPYAIFLAPYGLWQCRREKTALGFLAALATATSAIVVLGHDYPPGTSSVSERAAHLPMVGAIFLSAVAIVRLAQPLLLARALLAGAVACSLILSVRQVSARSSAPMVASARRIASFLETRLRSDERALVVAKPVDPSLIQHYLGVIAARKPEEVPAARRMVERFSLPDDYQRLVVSMPGGKRRLIEAGAWRGESVSWAVVFEDASDRIPEGLPLRRPPEAYLEDGKPVRVFRVPETRGEMDGTGRPL